VLALVAHTVEIGVQLQTRAAVRVHVILRSAGRVRALVQRVHNAVVVGIGRRGGCTRNNVDCDQVGGGEPH
jgi:hypothetical protein